jgi:4-hydroxy-tetrahydrodipicolinate synthase
MNKKIMGVYAVACTAFDKDGNFDEKVYRRHIRYLLDTCKVHGIVPAGSTGEFAFLTCEERSRVVQTAIDEVAKKVPVFAGSAACATRETVEYCQTAEKLGVDGVMVVSPYYGHLSQEELYQHFATVAQSIDLPIILYNNPGAAGSDVLPATIERLSKFDNICAVKESTGVMQRATELMRRCGDKVQVLCGCDTLPLEMFAIGVEGWVAAPANVIGRQCVELYELAVVKKDMVKAREVYYGILPVMDLFESTGQYVQLAKAALEIMGMPVGKPRPPLLPPEDDLLKTLKERIEEAYHQKF